MALLIEWLRGLGDQPAFGWIQLMDPHAPYKRGKPGSPPWNRYLAEVEHVDELIGNLALAIADKELRSRTYLIVSADHGEAFGEHNTKAHAHTVYEELVRVPFIVIGPGIEPRVIAEPVSLIDVGPTVLDLFGLHTPGHMMGQSLVPLLRGRNVQLSRPIVIDAGRRKQAIVGRDGLKAIRNLRQKTTELYDLNVDPNEAENLVETRPEEATRRLGELAGFFGVHELKKPGYTVPAR
jgi:arylsulfatase A-like enzyme